MHELKLESINKAFPDTNTQALVHVSCSFYAGTINALVGENGAGKSTLARILAGVDKPDSGKIYIDNIPHYFHNKKQSEIAGIGFVPQYPAVADNLYVYEQLYLGYEPTTLLIIADKKKCIKKSNELIHKYGFSVNPLKKISECSASEIREIEILKAIIKDINVLILDEPTTVLEKGECAKLFQIIKNLKQAGKIILYISHRVSEILELADTITILEAGKIIKHVEAQTVTKSELSKLVAGDVEEEKLKIRKTESRREPVIELEQIASNGSGADALYEINLAIYDHECVAVVGAEGNGLESLENILTGFEHPAYGTVKYFGKEILQYTQYELFKSILGYVPSDRERKGLCFNESVFYNCLGKTLFTASVTGFIRKCRNFAAFLINRFSIQGRLHAPVETLSGGNRQRLVFGRVLMGESRILLLANPFQGLDAVSKRLLREQLVQQAINKQTVLILTNDIEDLYEIPLSRIMVLYRGKLYPYDNSGTASSMEMLITGAIHV